MSVFKTIKDLQLQAINTKMVQMASYGAIDLYDNKATVKYPYVNLDVVDCSVKSYTKAYNVRIYACDRNEPYIAYNKCENIIDNLLKSSNLGIENYTIKFFTLNFNDIVNGAYVDAIIEVPADIECRYEDEMVLLENLEGFVVTEDGDYVIQE
jgi:hypothetical protein